ncbi:MAG: TetR/AcrR family transcriptional regulator [Pseudomonadales bacterium]
MAEANRESKRGTTLNRDTGRGTGTYAKGMKRRELLLDAAADLLREQTLDEISLKNIAEYAGIPIGSAYHFFGNAQALYTELANRFMLQLSVSIAQPYSGSSTESWRALFDTAVERAASLYAKHPAYRQLIIGGKAPPEIKLADRSHDERIGELMIAIISRHFEFPDFPQSRDVFFYATEIVDLMFSLSVMRNSKITPDMIAEAKKAAGAYLSQYLPDALPKKVSVATVKDRYPGSVSSGAE